MIKHDSKVKLHYSISSPEDLIYESTFEGEPLEIKIGDMTIPQRLEVTLYGLKENDEQSLILKPIDAFGERDVLNVKTLQKSIFPNKEMIRIGNVIEIDVQDKKGKTQPMFAIIKEINSNDVLLDLNHPLAGKHIKFRVKIIKINE